MMTPSDDNDQPTVKLCACCPKVEKLLHEVAALPAFLQLSLQYTNDVPDWWPPADTEVILVAVEI